jgi:outer membrane receptor for ferrienterochelin and colicins
MTRPAARQTRNSLSLRAGALSLLAGLSSAPTAMAGPEEEAIALATQIFEPAFYAAFAPRSALDMVDQTPGFAIKENDGKRGMGAGDANVLIDSRRIPVKSMSVREALSRIGADRVVRIEITDGARLDVPGLNGQVINIITRPTEMSGRWEWSPEFNEGSDPRLERGRVIVAGKLDDWEYNLGLSSYAWNGRSTGPETLLNGAGEPIEFRDEVERWKGRRHELSTAFSNESLSGSISNLGLLYAASRDASNERSSRTGIVADDHLRFYIYNSDGESLKINGDHEFAIGAGRLKLIGLSASSSSAPATVTLIEQLAGAVAPIGARVMVDKSSAEAILRGEYSWNTGDGDWQMALEGAVNKADAATAYAVLSNSLYADVPIAGGTSHVEEHRTEAALVHGRDIGGGVFMQAVFGAERSEIAQSGPNGKVREFVRPKGSFALSWSPAADWNANLRVERAVGQLDFGDFVSSVNLSDESGQQQSGNPEIVPEQSWDIALEANGEVSGLGPVRLKLYGRQIEDVNSTLLFARAVNSDDTITVVTGPGNLDSAVSYGIDVSGTLPTVGIGIPGGKLDWSASLRDSSIEDGVTGKDRNLSGTRHSYYSVNFRQDVPGTPWAWGLGYQESESAPGFGVTQTTYRWDSPDRVGAFVQHKDIVGMSARLSVSNLLDTEERFIRIGHTGTTMDPVAFVEDRTRSNGLQVGLNLSGSF